MGFYGDLLGAGFKTSISAGVGAAKMLGRGPLGGATLGAGIGGVYGGLSSDSNNLNNRLGDVFTGMKKGALIGGAAGVGVSMARNPIGTAKNIKSMYQPGMAKGLGKLGAAGLKAGRFAAENPRLTLGLGAAGIGAYSMNNSLTASPTMSGETTDQNYQGQSLAAVSLRSEFTGNAAIGTAPEMQGNFEYATTVDKMRESGTNFASNRMRNFSNSTNGLVQGLNRGRHG
jgi:hypothetical protein